MEEIKNNNEQIDLLSKKYFLTVNEASSVLGIGHNKIRDMIRENEYTADWIAMNGNRHLIKRKKFEEFLNDQSVI